MTAEPTTIQEHSAVVDMLRAAASALPVDAIHVPDVPVDIYLDEGFSAVKAAREHMPALAAVGLTAAAVDGLERGLNVLRSAQSLWNTEQRKGRSAATQADIDALSDARRDALEAGDLALRKSPEGQQRLSFIREGEGLPDLVQDGFDLGTLLTDAAPHFAAIHVDGPALARRMTELATRLQSSLAGEEAAKTLSGSKDMRDRAFTLTLEPLADVRAFAAFAFRNDRNNLRRHAFTSAYTRRKNRRAKKATPV